MKKIISIVSFLCMLFSSSLYASGIDVYLKNASEDNYEFYLKVDRPVILIHGEVSIPIITDPVPTRYVRVWKENNQWKGQSFSSSDQAIYNNYVKWSQSNKLGNDAVSYSYSGNDLSVTIGTYDFRIKNYKSTPVISQGWKGVNNGLINSYFSYPFKSYTQSADSVYLDSYTTDEGQAALTLDIPFSDKAARLTFVKNKFELNGLESLKADPNVQVVWDGDLKSIRVDEGDKFVFYYIKTTPWSDYNTGVINPHGPGWNKAPNRSNYLTAIGQCERIKTESIPSCRPVVSFDYARPASMESFPYLKGVRDDSGYVEHQYGKIGNTLAIKSSNHYENGSSHPQRATYTYALNSSGNPESLSEESVPNPRNNTREVTTYVTYGDYKGLANKVVRYGTVNDQELKLSQTTIDWLMSASSKEPLKSRIEDETYSADGSLTQTKITEKYYDEKDRLQKQTVITTNSDNDQIEDTVEYDFQNDYLVKKTETRFIQSPAYENGVSDVITKVFEFKYQNDRLVEQITKQGSHVTSDNVVQDSRGRTTSRIRKVNGQTTLTESISYSGERVSQRCENGLCIDYQYEDTATGYIERSSIKGTPYQEIHYDKLGRITSKTARGITRNTEYYAVDDAPAKLQEWLSVCPSDTVFVTYNSLPETVTCSTTQGNYTVRRGLNDRFIIAAELSPNSYEKQVVAAHFDGEEEITSTVTTDLASRSVEHVINGRTQETSHIQSNLTESYDKWGNIVRKRYDITGLLYSVEDHLGNTVRFTYNAHGKLTSSELNNQPSTKIEYRYDARGLRTDAIDPSRGHWRYHYNDHNQLEWQIDANGDKTILKYDNLNRITMVSTASSTVCYEYPTKLPLSEPQRVIQVKGQQQSCNSSDVQYEENNTFIWPNGWLKQREITLEDGYTQTTSYEYDQNGNVTKEYAPSRLGNNFVLETSYKNGVPYKWSNAATGEVYKTILDADASQRPTLIKLGNGIEEYRTYDPYTGLLSRMGGSRNGLTLYQFGYTYDDDQRLIERTRSYYYKNRSEASLTEEYTYDDADRLATHTIKQLCTNGICQNINVTDYISVTAEYTYDEYGNITYKSGVGDYYYESADPYKLTRLEQEDGTSREFVYDNNGNLLSDGLRDFSYENNRLVLVQTSENVKDNTVVDRDNTRFTYGPNGQQIVRTDKRFDIATLEWVTHKTLMAGAYTYGFNEGDESSKQEGYSGNGFSVSCTSTSCSTTYFHTDRIDQRFMLTDEDGEIVSQTFTDPFGATHNILLPEMNDAIRLSTNYASSSGHTGVAGFDLIHMNGRVYDPFLGRFIQADPFVKGREYVASYNRYSYVLNDPVNTLDPSGYWSLKKTVKRIRRKAKKELSRAESSIRHELSRAESRVRHEAKRLESSARNELKRVESSVRNEAKRIERQIRHESKRFERRVRHELGRWESDVRHGVKIIGKMVKENPEMVIAMAVAVWAVGPAAMDFFVKVMPGLLGTQGAVAGSFASIMTNVAAGAAAGATTSAASSVIMNKGSLKGIEKSILMGAVTGGIASGVAHGLMETDFIKGIVEGSTALDSGLTIALKTIGTSAADSLINGSDFGDSLLSSVLSNTANEQIKYFMTESNAILQSFVSAVSGGIITSSIYGGDFATNFASGYISAYIDYSYNALGGKGLEFDKYEALELTMDFIPVVSNLKSAYESFTGRTLFTKVKLSKTDRAMAAASIMFGPAAKAAKHAGKVGKFALKHGEEVLNSLIKHGDDTLSFAGEAKYIDDVVRHGDDVVENGGGVIRRSDDIVDTTDEVDDLYRASSEVTGKQSSRINRIEYGDGEAVYYVDHDTGLTHLADGVISGPHLRRGKGTLPNPVGGRKVGEHRGHLIPEGGVDNPNFVNVVENIISEAPSSNLGLKKILDLKVSKVAAQNPGSEIRFMAEPIRHVGEARPFAVTYYIVKDGEIVEALSVLNK